MKIQSSDYVLSTKFLDDIFTEIKKKVMKNFKFLSILIAIILLFSSQKTSAVVINNPDGSKVWFGGCPPGETCPLSQMDSIYIGILQSITSVIQNTACGGAGVRNVDTIYQKNDSIIYKINGEKYYILQNSILYSDTSEIKFYTVLSTTNNPVGSPIIGATYLIGTSPTGVWAAHAKEVAVWTGSYWTYYNGVQGTYLYNTSNALTYQLRSNNWVQVPGIPALNNGNTISSGLRIGTNNTQSLTFETNNVNRARIDSIGRLHVYNLPASVDTFVAVVDVNGKFGKIGKKSFSSDFNFSLFPNGVEFVTQSRNFQTSDKGKALVLMNHACINMPTGDLGVLGENYVAFICQYNDSYIELKPTNDNSLRVYSLSELQEIQTNETLTLSIKTLNSQTYLSLLTGSVIYDGDTLKTSARYFYDKSQNEKILDLGTITFNDVNNAAADFDININKPYYFPIGYYVDKLFVNQTEAFDGGLIAHDITDNNSGVSELLSNEVFYRIFAPTAYEFANSLDYHASFNNGNGEVNPRNLTTGSITIKAIIKKIPN